MYTGKKWRTLCGLACTALVLVGCSKKPGTPSEASEPALRLAVTTSAANSGLLDMLLPIFEKKHGVQVEVIAKGSGMALSLAREGKADVVLVHARVLEDAFIADGFGLNRRGVMQNDFVIVGPPDDPHKLKTCTGAVDAFRRIIEGQALFLSRGDDSGTHVREKELWRLVGAAPSGDRYRQANAGMADTLRMAAQQDAYCLTDLGTFLFHHDALHLVTVLQGDQLLHNPYSIIAVNPTKVPSANFEKAMRLVDFLTSLEAQEIIGAYGQIRFGRALFTPVMVH